MITEERLRPYQGAIQFFQEVFLWRRPVFFAAFVLYVMALFIYAISADIGFFASIFYVTAAIYIPVAIFNFVGKERFSKIVKPVEYEVPAKPNTPLTFEEFVAFLRSFSNCHNCPCKRLPKIAFPAICLVLAIFFKFVKPIYFNFFATIVIMFLPGVLHLQPVYEKAGKFLHRSCSVSPPQCQEQEQEQEQEPEPVEEVVEINSAEPEEVPETGSGEQNDDSQKAPEEEETGETQPEPQDE